MLEILKKKIHPIITYPVLILFSISLVVFPLFFYVRSTSFAQGFLLPFEGRITNVDYVSCVCGLSMLLTITPTTQEQQGQQPQQLLFFYGAEVLERLGLLGDLPLPIPRVFANYMIFSPGSQKLLGNYLPYPFPCVQYVPPVSCGLNGFYPAILNVGTSWY
jgi:hypothetical protein